MPVHWTSVHHKYIHGVYMYMYVHWDIYMYVLQAKFPISATGNST